MDSSRLRRARVGGGKSAGSEKKGTKANFSHGRGTKALGVQGEFGLDSEY